MVARSYVPDAGDLVWLTFDPQAGHEQKGGRPALVLSNDLFNQRTGLAMVCPITRTERALPFHVAVPPETSIGGFAMIEQIKSVNYRARRARFIAKMPKASLNEALGILDACIY